MASRAAGGLTSVWAPDSVPNHPLEIHPFRCFTDTSNSAIQNPTLISQPPSLVPNLLLSVQPHHLPKPKTSWQPPYLTPTLPTKPYLPYPISQDTSLAPGPKMGLEGPMLACFLALFILVSVAGLFIGLSRGTMSCAGQGAGLACQCVPCLTHVYTGHA